MQRVRCATRVHYPQMKIFLALDDLKAGPFTIFQVEEKLRSNEVSESTLGWYEGLEKWAPLRDLAPFESFFRLRDADEENERRRKQAERMAKEEVTTAPDVTGPQHSNPVSI